MNALDFPKSPAAAILAERRQTRYQTVLDTIPAAMPARLRQICADYATIAVGQLNVRQLARVGWLWRPRPALPNRGPVESLGHYRRRCRALASDRVRRGRASNPTAL